MNIQGIKAIYLHEMDRMRRTIFQSILQKLKTKTIDLDLWDLDTGYIKTLILEQRLLERSATRS